MNIVDVLPQDKIQPPKYPSSSKKLTDWDKIEKEIEKEENIEKPEGEAGLNYFLEKIYGSGSDEVRRAMNKSFVSVSKTFIIYHRYQYNYHDHYLYYYHYGYYHYFYLFIIIIVFFLTRLSLGKSLVRSTLCEIQ